MPKFDKKYTFIMTVLAMVITTALIVFAVTLPLTPETVTLSGCYIAGAINGILATVIWVFTLLAWKDKEASE